MTNQPSSRWPWIMLFSRISLFIGLQALFALGFLLAGSSAAWENAGRAYGGGIYNAAGR